MQTKTVVFIHGNFVSKHCWDAWLKRYEQRGYTCVAIAYPGREAPVPALKSAHPDPALRKLGLREVIDHHVRIIEALPEKPILIGHSFGGLLTQILISRGLGVAAVAIDSVPPQGVLSLEWSFFRATWPSLNPFAGNAPFYMSFAQWQYAFVNGMPLAEQRAAYDAQTVPESRRLSRGALGPNGRVDFKRRRPPLLVIGGELDHIMPASLSRTIARKYRNAPSITEYKEFAGRNHYLIGAKGWEEIADYALHWAEQKQGADQPVPMRRAG